MSDVKTNLRQATAEAIVWGVISEMSLEKKRNEKTNKNCIVGSITVKTSEVNFVQFFVNADETTRNGESNPAYEGLATVMTEYHSIAGVGEEQATKVKTKGQVSLYTSTKTGKDVVSFKSSFFTRDEGMKPEEYKAEFAIETYIKSIAPEMNRDGEETGRVLVKGWTPVYDGGVQPVTLVAGVEDGIADAIRDAYHSGETVEFLGDINNNRVEYTKEIPVAIGKPRIERVVEYKNDMMITGATAAYDENSPQKPYDKDTIDLAVRLREEEKDNKAASASTTKPTAAGTGRQLNF